MLNKKLLMVGVGSASAKIHIQTYVPVTVFLKSGEEIYLEGTFSTDAEATYDNIDVAYIECIRRRTHPYSVVNLHQESVELSYRFTVVDIMKPAELILYYDN